MLIYPLHILQYHIQNNQQIWTLRRSEQEIAAIVEILETHLAVLRECKINAIEASFAKIREGQQGT